MKETPDPKSGEIVYSRMRWNAPLSEEHASLLLDRLGVSPGDEVVDLGCGWGELLHRAGAPVVTATGLGVDTNRTAILRGRNALEEAGLSDRITLSDEDASKWTAPADRVVCVGASHAWGNSREALKALRGLLRPQGRILFGDGCWDGQPPTDDAVAMLGDEILTLTDLVDTATELGWRVIHVSTADQREWDDFEGTWRAGRQEWLLAHPDDHRADQIRKELDSQLRDYLGTYRNVLGFAYLVLSH